MKEVFQHDELSVGEAFTSTSRSVGCCCDSARAHARRAIVFRRKAGR